MFSDLTLLKNFFHSYERILFFQDYTQSHFFFFIIAVWLYGNYYSVSKYKPLYWWNPSHLQTHTHTHRHTHTHTHTHNSTPSPHTQHTHTHTPNTHTHTHTHTHTPNTHTHTHTPNTHTHTHPTHTHTHLHKSGGWHIVHHLAEFEGTGAGPTGTHHLHRVTNNYYSNLSQPEAGAAPKGSGTLSHCCWDKDAFILMGPSCLLTGI